MYLNLAIVFLCHFVVHTQAWSQLYVLSVYFYYYISSQHTNDQPRSVFNKHNQHSGHCVMKLRNLQSDISQTIEPLKINQKKL